MFELAKVKTLHFTGLKGVGMTALACMAVDFGLKVFGSDVDGKFVTDPVLAKKGLSCDLGFSSERIKKLRPDAVVYTAAHGGEENIEVQTAIDLGIPVFSFAQILGQFFNSKAIGISVAGVGGKTTVSAWLATTLEALKKQPSYMVGVGQVSSLDFPGKFDANGKIFISEADEYKSSLKDERPKFYYQNPKLIVIPNLAFDHPDIYQDETATLATFKTFIESLPADGALVINLDCPLSRKLLEISQLKAKVLSYGQNFGDYRIHYNLQEINNFQVTKVQAEISQEFSVAVPGLVNIFNATAVILACQAVGISWKEAAQVLQKYRGLSRRFELIYGQNSCQLIDDYAHHPEEIKSTLATARQSYSQQKIVAIFQAHTYSRTKALLAEFSQSFKEADQVYITDIFASAREQTDPQINGQVLAHAIAKSHPYVTYVANQAELLNLLEKQDLQETVLLTIGAGDIYLWHPELIKLIKHTHAQ